MAKDILTWDITDVIKDEKDFSSKLKTVENSIPKYKKYFSELDPKMDKEKFREMILFDEKINEISALLSSYVHLIEAQNMKSQKKMKYESLLDNVFISLSEVKRPIEHWIKGKGLNGKKKLDDRNAKRLFRSVPKISYKLNYSRLAAKHTLDEQSERIIFRKDMNGIDVVNGLYEKIVNDFRFRMKIKKSTKKLSLEEIVSFFTDSDPEKRRRAYSTVMNKFGENKEKLYTIYAAIVKDWAIERELRKFDSAISVRNFANHIDDKAVSALMNSCEKNRDVFWDMFKSKAKYLGKRKLSRYDVNAPMLKERKKVKFAQARKIVLDSLKEFSPSFHKKALSLFNGHIDSHPRKDKMPGGFCMAVTPKVTPYILMNFTGRQNDVFTLAHEIGHAIHDIYASENTISSMHPGLPLAETASTLSEMITFEKTLEKASETEKLSLLSEKMTSFYASISRQNYFVKFELDAHEKIPLGLTEKELSDIYYKNLLEQFGNSLYVPKEFRYEWAYVQHIFRSPFYCYAYNFGELLSLSLYSRYKEEGKRFIPEIEKILRAGGSRDPAALLNEIGMDIGSEKFWNDGFDIVKDFQKRLSEHI